jgi:hypothetical protein
MRMVQTMWQECQLCGGNTGADDRAHQQNVALFGAGAFCVCPKCGSDTSERKRSPEWRNKCRLWVKAKLQGRLEEFSYET